MVSATQGVNTASVTLRHLMDQRQEILRIARSHRAKDVHVFGSVARGEDNPDSDIDVLVTLEKEATLFDLVHLQQDLAALLGRAVDAISMDGLIQDWDGRSASRRENILRDAVLL